MSHSPNSAELNFDFSDYIPADILAAWDSEEAHPAVTDGVDTADLPDLFSAPELISELSLTTPPPPNAAPFEFLGITASDIPNLISQTPLALSGDPHTAADNLPHLSTISAPPAPGEFHIILELFYHFSKQEVATVLMLQAARTGLSLFLRTGIFPGSPEVILSSSWSFVSRSFGVRADFMPVNIAQELIPPVCFFCTATFAAFNPILVP